MSLTAEEHYALHAAYEKWLNEDWLTKHDAGPTWFDVWQAAYALGLAAGEEMRRDALRKAHLEGQIESIRDYAVWKDGEQFVGVMRRPLAEALRPLLEDIAAIDAAIAKEREHG